MVYKRFIQRGEKVYGPYNYQSKKVDGKVVSEYVGKPNVSNHRRGILAIFIFTLLLVFAFLFFQFSPTGNVSLNLNEKYQPGEIIDGILKFSLSPNEFIPADSLVTLNLNNQTHSIQLKDLISNPSQGNFKADGTSITGNGAGFGSGTQKVYPTISFEYKIAESQVPGGGRVTNETTETSTTPSTETPVTEQTPSTTETTTTTSDTTSSSTETPVTEQTPATTIDTPTDTSTASSATDSSPATSTDTTSSGSGMTGNVVAEETKTGTVSYDKPFTYDLADGETLEIISANVDGYEISTDNLKIQTSNSVATITTEYSIEENVSTDLQIDLSKFNITAEGGSLKVELSYNDEKIATTSKDIVVDSNYVLPSTNLSLNQTIVNETIVLPFCNETITENCTNLINQTIIIPNCNETDIINCTTVCMNFSEIANCSLFFNSTIENVSMNITTLVSNIRVGEPVHWKKIVRLNQSDDNVTIEIPSIAENVSVNKIDLKNQTLDDNSFSITGNVVAQVDLNKSNEGFLTKLWNKLFSFTGNVIEGGSMQEVGSSELQTTDSQLLTVTENVTNIEVTYETEAPTANETNISGGKQIVISGPDSIHYQNVTAFSYIAEIPLENISVFWVDQNKSVQFDGYDTNDDGNVDYIEWIVPHLSNQTYKIFGLLPNGGTIDFVDPTPVDSANVSTNSILINVSIVDPSLNNVSFDFNGTKSLGKVANDNSTTELTDYKDSSLALALDFDGANGLTDLSGNGNSATAYGGAFINTSNGEYVDGLQLNGAGAYLTTPANSNYNFGTKDFTISVWVKQNDVNNYQHVIGTETSGNFMMSFNSPAGGAINVGRHNIAWDFSASDGMSSGIWYNLVLMRANGYMSAYVDGAMIGTPAANSNSYPTDILDIGMHAGGATYFNGMMDELRIYNRSLSLNEIKELYNSSYFKKLNSTDFIFQKTQSNLVTGSYTYSATACDASSVCNSTETRNLQVILPKVNLTVDSSLVSGLSVESNSLFYVLFNLSCTNTNCGNISVYLDPIGSTCVAETSTCDSTCGSVFKATPSSFSYSSNGLCGQYMGLPDFTGCTATDANGVYTTAIDSVCDYYLGPGTGDCARFGDYNMYADYVCPSYQRKGSAVTEADCVIPSEFCGPANLALTDIFDFSSPFFATGDVVKGLVNTTIGATPFWTATNPMNISLNNGESYLVNFTVNASGQDSVKPYKFYAWANVSSTPSISSVSLKFNVTIIPSFNPINIIYPQAIAYNSDVTTFDYSYTGSGDRCWYTTNSGVTNSSTVTAGTNFTSVSVNLGYNTWIIYCNTSSNTIYSKNVTFLRDIIPQVSFISPTPTNNNISLSKPTINVSIFDYNLKNISFNWNGTSSSIYDDNLVLMYNFDDYNLLNDSSNNGNNASCSGSNCPSLTTGKYGKAYSFNGGNSYISSSLNSGISGDAEFTISTWFNEIGSTGGSAIVGFGNANVALQGASLFTDIGGDGSVSVQFAGGHEYRTASSQFANGGWHNLIATKTPGAISSTTHIYLDGVEIPSITASGSAPSIAAEKFYAGKFLNYAGNYFYGSIDEVRIYNRSLSASEVQAVYNSNLAKFNSTQWYLLLQKNNVGYGVHNYSLNACDNLGQCNSTETRNFTYLQCSVSSDCSTGFSCVNNFCVDNINPLISFISPTLTNNNITTSSSTIINISVTEANLKNLTLNFDSSKLLFEEPPIRSGLVLWTSADRGVTKDSSNKTSVWADQSGNGNSFVQSSPSQQPTWIQNSVNGRPALRMVASSSQTMYSSTNYPAPTTVIYAAKTNGGTVGRVLAGKANNWILGWYSGGKNEAYFEGWVNNPNTAPTTTPVIYSATIGGSGVNSNFYGNGNLLASNQGGVTGPNGLCLSGYQCSSEFSDADVFEVLVYNRILNSTELADVNGYLAVKYGLSSSLPQNNSYYNITMPKINSTDYLFTILKSNLDYGNHTYFSNITDFAGNKNSTEVRNLIVALPSNSNPSVDMFYPLNNITVGKNNLSFFCNGTGSPYLVNLTLYIWDSSNNIVYSNLKVLGGVTNSSSWNYSFSNKDQYKWNCLGGGSNGNFSWSNQGNYTLNAGYNSLKTVYTYTGADQIYTVPAGVNSIEAKMWGAGGGGGYHGGWSYGYAGGAGGYSNIIMNVTPGQNITVVVGQGGNKGSTSNTAPMYGGGARSCSGSDCRYGGAGGGRSALRAANTTELITAGGGGGGGASRDINMKQNGGAGGGATGQDGFSLEVPSASGKGGSQTSGGAGGTSTGTSGQAGSQFMGGYSGTNSYGGGGGGGYYGGGGGAYQESNTMGGAGGGSGYTLFGGTTITGVNNTAANSADSDRLTAGNGGNENTDGANGKVIIITYGDFPEINLSLVSPVIPKNVSTGSLFNMIFNLTCSGANCGLINVFLDPQPTGSLTNGLIPTEFGSAIDGTGAIYGCQGFTSGADKATDGDITTGYAWWDGFSYTDSGVVFSLPSNYSIAQINTIYRTSDSPCNCWCAGMPSVIRIEVYDYATSNWITPAGMSNINSGSENTWYNETATTPVSSDKVRVVAQDNGASLMEIEVYGSTGGGPKGLVNISLGAIPFYTPTNPINVSLNSGQSQLVTFSVTANGANSSTPYAFFGFANVSATPTVGSISNQVNVTIVYQINPLTIVYPSATTYLYNVNSLNYTLDVPGDKCWYSIDSGVTNSSSTAAGTNFTGISSVPGTNLWTVYCNDSNSTLYSNSVIFTRDIPPQISFVSPTPANGVNTTNTSPIINFSIISSNLKNVTFNWNGANTSYKISSDVTMATNYNDPTLMLALDFDNDTNALVDLSTSGNNGTAGGNAVYTSSGKYNGGFTFDGSGDYITRTNPILPSLNSNRTIALWEKTSATGRQILFGIGNSGAYAEVTLYPDIGTGFFLDTSAGYLGTGGATPDDGNWHHLAVTYNGSVWKTYLDGVPKNNLTLVSNLNNNVYSVGVDSNNLATYPFNGQIDEVRVYNRSLSDAEIQEIYNSSLKKLNSTDWNLQVNKNNLSFGTYTYSSSACDTSNNCNLTETRSLIVDAGDLNAPLVNLLSPLNNSISNTTNFVNFIFNVSDVSNISSCTLSALVPGVVLATGGNITTAGNYIVHTFTTNGTFSIPSGALNVEVLVVAGGGSGGGSSGTSIAGGGGGAGGLIYNLSYNATGNISVVVGKGGIGQTGFTAGRNGANSSFGNLIAVGGGYGGTWSNAPSVGGSGGAAGENGQGLDGAAGIAGQGHAGGNDNGYDSGAASAGGGGGGAGTVGSDAVTNTLGGNGGAGFNYTINGSNVYYAGGGGGAGSTSAGVGGNSSGGSGRAVTTGTGIAGVNGTGGGGGGSLTNGNEASQPGGNGGSGIVIVRYLSGSATNSSSSITNNANNSLSLNLSNGNYTWSVSCIDNSSNHNVGISNETRSLIVQNFGDIYAPVINLLSPINNTIQTVSSFVNFIFNVSDASNISYCNLTASSGAIVSTTGGDSVVNSGNYTIHTFSSNGTFSIPSGALNVEVMVVGGGASGGARVGGGGGAGGVILANQSLVSGIYSIVVGNGGASVSSSSGGARGNDGYNSSFNNLLALGGGGGGEYSTLWNGRNGGSGGGGDGYQSGLGGTGLQGYNGGAGSGGSGSGGGGGAGGIGATASGDTGGNGGAGVLSSINGSSVYYAGGGGGTGNSVAGSGGSGIGGNGMAGSNTPAGDGLANTGSGGGGVRDISDSGNKISGAGGSGVVIIRYLTSSVGGGINSSMNITNNANNSLSLSLSNGNYSWSVACADNSTNHNIGSSLIYNLNVSVAQVSSGVLNISFIYPRQNITVDSSSWFNVSFNVSCNGGDCGNVSVSLDPEQLNELYSSGSVIVDLNKKETEENIFVKFLNYIKLNLFGVKNE